MWWVRRCSESQSVLRKLGSHRSVHTEVVTKKSAGGRSFVRSKRNQPALRLLASISCETAHLKEEWLVGLLIDASGKLAQTQDLTNTLNNAVPHDDAIINTNRKEKPNSSGEEKHISTHTRQKTR